MHAVNYSVMSVLLIDVMTQRSADDTSRKLNIESNNSNSVDFIKGLQQLQKVDLPSHNLLY